MMGAGKEEETEKMSSPSDEVGSSGQKLLSRGTRKWGLRHPWLFLPLAVVVSILLGMTCGIIGMGLGPSDRSISLGIAVVTFPMISGTALNRCLGSKRPWKSLLSQFVGSLVLAAIAWGLTHFRFYA